jgi:sodium-dependent dicarboxylate transporter 2/3/5
LAAVVAISSSGAFMLPVATPPNMLVYSFGLVSLRDLLSFGLIMNILALILNIIITYNFAP